MGIGKYFHRDKSDSPKESKSRSRATSFGAVDPSLQTSRYESMPPSDLPKTGTYPLKGNNSTAAVTGQKSAFRQSMDNRPNQNSRPETAPSSHTITTRTTTTTTTLAPRISIPKMNNNNFSDYQFFDQDQPAIPDRGSSFDQRRMQPDTGLEQNFSGMRLGNDASSATLPPVPYYAGSGSAPSRIDPRVDSVPRNDPGLRMVNQAGQQPSSPSYGRQNVNPQQQYSPAYNNRSSNQGYGQPLRSPTANQGYEQSSRTPTANQGYEQPSRTSTANQGYEQYSRSPTANQGSEQPSRAPKAHQGYDQVLPRDSSNQGYGQASKSPTNNPRMSGVFSDVDEEKAARRASIPRKQVGTSGYAPSSSATSSPVSANYSIQEPSQPPPPVPRHQNHLSQQQPAYQDGQSATTQRAPAQQSKYNDARNQPQYDTRNQHSQYQDPSAVPQGLNYYGNSNQGNNPQSRAPPLFPRAHHASSGIPTNPAAQDIVERAKTNTRDTEVIEKIAPAIVQEKVIQKVHHKREEVITREIHTHDVHHRILPIIDVEVLPPRHFLPVEGGGLVEIGADEVPGRAKNWVIAETASKIPSDQPAPKGGASMFTARAFPGREGDKTEWVDREGVKRSEETWVHPPALETGGQETGQTWPMVFGREEAKGRDYRSGHSQSASRDGKKKKRRSESSALGGAGQGQYGSSY